MIKAVIYARYSSVNQREQSIADQVAACEDYAARNDIHIVNVYADYAQSGRTDNRDQFQIMLKQMVVL